MTRKSEIIIPEGVAEVYQIKCETTGQYTSILDENGLFGTLMGIQIDAMDDRIWACHGVHTKIRIELP